ncbi:MAG: hypothetical protein V7K48_23940 [Nostoc sp.]|uniref:hypothetical protein n=1 Tax=Nostoc sp. TaxID=1180 RepID=UPI002FFD50F3
MAAGKGRSNILRDEFYEILLVMDSAAKEKIRTFVLLGVKVGVRSLYLVSQQKSQKLTLVKRQP